MFFRLSKNVVKNVYFDPFGGGYPPSPPQNVFIRKKSFFSFGLGASCKSVLRTNAYTPRESSNINVITKLYFVFFSLLCCYVDIGALGGGVRVRTRNALHEVGADLSQA